MSRTRKGAVPAAVPIKLDLGCGANKREGFLGADIAPIDGVDVVHDLTQAPWPWADGSVAEVHCSHFFEHLTGLQRMAFMDELYRVLQDGATATIIVPYGLSRRAMQDPTHQWPPVVEASLLYFNRQWRQQSGLDHYPIHCDFDYSYAYQVDPLWAGRSQEARDFGLRHYFEVASDLIFTCTKRP